MLSREEYNSHDLVGLSELVSSGDVSPVEMVETAIREIEARNPEINAVVNAQFDRALDELKNRTDTPRFLGMPYLIKDLHAPVKGLPLTNGSQMMRNQVFDFDSTTVARLRAAGFAILGRSNSPEFGMSASTEPILWGPTRNAHNTEYSAGGSSGGAAAAVAAGMTPAAHATDSAGSIRIPAARCGLVGLKPTRGINAFGPHRGDMVFGISHEHAVTRTVRDSAALLDITAGPDSGAPYYTATPDTPYETLCTRDPGQLKIGFTTESFTGVPIDPECRRAVMDAAKKAEAVGHHVVEARPDFDGQALTDAMIRILIGSLIGMFRMAEQQLGRPLGDGDIEPMTQDALAFARTVSLADHMDRVVVLNTETRRIAAFFDDYDLLLTPMTAAPALKLGALDTTVPDMEGFLDKLFGVAPFTAPFNVTGQPAMSMPLATSTAGMPIGVQLVGRFGHDATVMQVARQLLEEN